MIITHLHHDHCGSLSQLILFLWFRYGKKTRVITKCKNIGIYLEITGTTKEAYEITDEYKDIRFIETEHVKELDCYGFKAKIHGKNIIYTGDTKIIEPFLKHMDNVSELYIDVSKNSDVHMKFIDIINILQNLKQKGIHIYLMHIDDYDHISKINKGSFYFA